MCKGCSRFVYPSPMMLSMGDAVQAYSLTLGDQARLKDIVNIFEPCRNDEYGCFSNFAHYGFELDGKWWMTSEHYFQAQKFYGTQCEEEIRLLDSPMKAAEMGRNRNLPLRKDWEQVKDSVMREAVFAKFNQNEEIRKVLLATGKNVIVEKTTDDYYWGCGKDGTGKNMLGKILMEIRDQL